MPPVYLLNLVSEDLPAVVLTEPSPCHDAADPLGPQEDLGIAQHGVVEGFVAGDLCLAFKEALKKRRIRLSTDSPNVHHLHRL